MITEAEAINLGIKYKKENPKCFHSAKYCAKKNSSTSNLRMV